MNIHQDGEALSKKQYKKRELPIVAPINHTFMVLLHKKYPNEKDLGYAINYYLTNRKWPLENELKKMA